MLLDMKDIRLEDNVRFSTPVVTDLARSMKAIGQITPITVVANGDGYIVIAGERRFTAAKDLRWSQIEAYVSTETENRRLAQQLAENISRENLTHFEIAQGMLDLKVELGMKQDDIADAMGMDKKDVSEYQRIAKGASGIDPAVLNQLKFRELEPFADLHDMSDQLRDEFVEKIEDTPRDDIGWTASTYITEVKKQRWLSEKPQKEMLAAFDKIGAFPMDRDDRNGAWALHDEEVIEHEGQPCHGWMVGRSWANNGQDWDFMFYCLDPKSHRPEEGTKIEDYTPLQAVAVRATDSFKSTGTAPGMNAEKEQTKKRKLAKDARKEAIVSFATDVKKLKLAEMVQQTLLNIQRDYRWQELGKPFGLTKPDDSIHFDWSGYLDGFTEKEALDQRLVLAVGSVYLALTPWRRDSPEWELLTVLDELFATEYPEGGDLADI